MKEVGRKKEERDRRGRRVPIFDADDALADKFGVFIEKCAIFEFLNTMLSTHTTQIARGEREGSKGDKEVQGQERE